MKRDYQNLRDFLSFLEERNQVKKISTSVSPNLEITEIADRVVKQNGPALLFKKVEGSNFPVAINLFGSFQRIAWALGADYLEAVVENMLSLLPDGFPSSFKEKLDALLKIKGVANSRPYVVKSAPCQDEVILGDDVDLGILPVLKCWPKDAGRFITFPMVITKDPHSGMPNMGMYRMQIFDKQTTGMHWHIHHTGANHYRKYKEMNERMPVAVAIGGDPATIYSSTAPVPEGFDELMFAGILRGKPVNIVKATQSDLMVPAEAEFVIEGYVDPQEELRTEGPFGDHTGYYSLVDKYPVFHVTAITHRRDAIYPTTIVGRPPMEDCYMAKATERLFLPAIKAFLPEIKDINLPFEGVFHNCVLVSIEKRFPKHAHKVINGLWGMGQMSFSKAVVVFDDDVNIQDPSEATWKLFNNTDPARDIIISEGPLDTLDHSSPRPFYGSKIGIDATKKIKEEHDREWPEDIHMSEKIVRLVNERWQEYGI